MSEVTELNADNFDTEIANGTPVLVDFWAEWCAPCRAIAPILKEIASEKDGAIRIGKLNVDEHPDIAQRFDVMSIPTLLLFTAGSEKARIVGARPKEALLREIEPHL